MRIKGVIQFTRDDVVFIEQAIVYIGEHYKDCISGEQLSTEVNLNVKKLRAGIKKKTGHTLREYLFRVRVDKSKDLLLTSNYPLKYIVNTIGFKTESHFCRKFKQFELMTPLEFRFQRGLDSLVPPRQIPLFPSQRPPYFVG